MTNSHRTAEGTTVMPERHVCIETPCSVCGYSEDESMNASIVRDVPTLQAMRKSAWDLFTDGYISQSALNKAVKAINSDIDKLV